MEAVGQTSFLYEEDYMIRTTGSISQSPDIALTELVANAWDAGASRVDITIPETADGELIVEDNGTGLTYDQFHKRWMILGYNRHKHQGDSVEFPPGSLSNGKRKAYGRNGVGRHGLLCFSNSYTVITSREGSQWTFKIATSQGESPFKLVDQTELPSMGHGTKLVTSIIRNKPDPERLRRILSARFLFDPQFKVVVNGLEIDLEKQSGFLKRDELVIDEKLTVEVMVFDSSKNAKKTDQHGIAFWVGNRLVGEPTWSLDNRLLDGRTSVAKRFTFVIKTDELYEDVLPDWSGFKKTQRMTAVYDAVETFVAEELRSLFAGKIEDTRKLVIEKNRETLRVLKPIEKLEVSQFVENLTTSMPTIGEEFLSAALRAFVNLENTRSGTALLQKLATFSESDIDGLNKMLDEWSVNDALLVLDEIDKRLKIIATLEQLSGDKSVDELHTLHPLVLQSRWIFGPEFDSVHYYSNSSLNTIASGILKKKDSTVRFINGKKRPDIFILGDSTLSVTATDAQSEESGLTEVGRVLIIELKKGGFSIGRDEMNQAQGYVEDILGCDILCGSPRIDSFVVGHTIDDSISKAGKTRKTGTNDSGVIHACTYRNLIMSANSRLFRLKEQLNERYGAVARENLVDEVLGNDNQISMKDAVLAE